MIIHENPENPFLKIVYHSKWEEALENGNLFSFAKYIESNIMKQIPKISIEEIDLVINLCIRWLLDEKEHKLAIYEKNNPILYELKEQLYSKLFIYKIDYLGTHMDADSAKELRELYKGDAKTFADIIYWMLSDSSMVPVVEEFCPGQPNASIAKFEKEKLEEKIVKWLRNNKGMQYDNYLLDLGNQVVEGDSMYWDIYEETVKDMINNELKDMPLDLLLILWYGNNRGSFYININKEYDEEYFDISIYDTREAIEKDIEEELFQNICCIAEEAYDEYIQEQYEKEHKEQYDEED